MTTPTAGRIEAIWIKPGHRQPMKDVLRARLLVDRGLEGNAHQGGRRQVTVLDAGQWDAVQGEIGAPVDPRSRRANLFVRGLDLRDSRGKVLKIGATRLAVGGETRPCRLMDDAQPGLCRALDPEWRGGIFGRVVDGGEIAVGDEVTWEP